MDGLKKGCPDDTVLEALIYDDLPALKRLSVRAHLVLCADCRKRLERLRAFSEALSKVDFEEPPADFVLDLVKSVDSWGVPTPVPVVEEDSQSAPLHGAALRWRWALGAMMFAISGFLQWRYGDYLPGFLSGNYVSTLKGLQSLWDFVWSGALWQNITQVVAAIRTDGISALQILGNTLPSQVAGVVVFGGIVTAVFVSQLRASRRRGEGHR